MARRAALVALGVAAHRLADLVAERLVHVVQLDQHLALAPVGQLQQSMYLKTGVPSMSSSWNSCRKPLSFSVSEA